MFSVVGAISQVHEREWGACVTRLRDWEWLRRMASDMFDIYKMISEGFFSPDNCTCR